MKKWFIIGSISFLVLVGAWQAFTDYYSAKTMAPNRAMTLAKNIQSRSVETPASESEQDIIAARMEDITVSFAKKRTAVRDILNRAGMSPEKQQTLINDFALIAPPEYFQAHVGVMLGDFAENKKLVQLLGEFNALVHEQKLFRK